MTTAPYPYWYPPPRNGMVRVGPFLPLRDLLREFGVPPERVWQKFGFAESTFSDPENTIAAEVRGAILADCARETGCRHFGLLLGQRIDASSLGAIGFMVRNAPDARTALSELAANLRFHNRAAAPYLEVAGRQAIFVFETLYPYAEGWEQIDDGAMAGLWNIMRTLCGSGWLPNEVRFRRGKAGQHRSVSAFLQGSSAVRCRADCNDIQCVVAFREGADSRPGLENLLRAIRPTHEGLQQRRSRRAG